MFTNAVGRQTAEALRSRDAFRGCNRWRADRSVLLPARPWGDRVNVDVGVVGAGPAGLLAANALVRAGIECAVFERLSEDATRARARAGQIDAGTVELLDRHELSAGLRARGVTSEACEFRRGGIRHVFDYAALTGCRNHFYPQQLLVGDMIDALRAQGSDVTFGCAVAEIRIAERPVIGLASGEKVCCDFVLGCDGFHGVCRHALTGATCSGMDFGALWLAFLAEVPSGDHGVYGLHRDGFAGHMPRSATVSRFYLQIEPGTDPNDLSDEWIWSEITPRLDANGIELVPGRILERGTVELHSYVTEPMHHGRLFLAGDAAHIVTPAGGKGMNLALQDADELVTGLLDHYRSGNDRGLDAYSRTRLARVWRVVEFSHWMLDLLLARPGEGRFREGLRDARLARLLSGGQFAEDFATNYVGPSDTTR
jgi:p-hydroxybenzoate 3-monooxygenase